MSNTTPPTAPKVPVGPSTIAAIMTAVGFAAGAVAAAISDRTPEAIGAAATALGAVVTLVASRTSQANALTAAAAPKPEPIIGTVAFTDSELESGQFDEELYTAAAEASIAEATALDALPAGDSAIDEDKDARAARRREVAVALESGDAQ